MAKLKDYVMEEEMEKKAGRSEAPEAPPEPENGAQEKIVISAPSKKVAFAIDKGNLLSNFLFRNSSYFVYIHLLFIFLFLIFLWFCFGLKTKERSEFGIIGTGTDTILSQSECGTELLQNFNS